MNSNGDFQIYGKHPILWFIVVFVLFLIFAYWVIVPFFRTHIGPSWVRLVVEISAAIMRFLGYDVSTDGLAIVWPQTSMTLNPSCAKVASYLLLASAILAFPASFRAKFVGIVVGILIQWVTNLVRILSFCFTVVHFPNIGKIIHDTVWSPLPKFIALLFFIIWIWWVTRNRPVGPMFPPELIGKFFFQLLLCYGLLVILWFGVLKDPCTGIFAKSGNYIFERFGTRNRFCFQPVASSYDIMDSEVVRQGFSKSASVRFSICNIAFVPTAMVIALVVATPSYWPRRHKALLLGLLFSVGFLVLRMAIVLLHIFTDDKIRLFVFSPFWQKGLSQFVRIACFNSISFLAAIFIWLFVLFRHNAWDMINQSWQKGKSE